MSTYPPPLLPGSTIGVMAPSSYVEREDIEKSKTHLESLGYKVFIHPQSFERHNQSAGTVLQKSLAFQGLWQREDINTIWLAGGGNRAGQLLESINFEKLKTKPKNLIGFSDATVLLNAVHTHTGQITFHGPLFKHAATHKDLQSTLDTLAGKTKEIDLGNAQIIKDGKAEGKLIGGCLSLFQTLIGTKHMPDMNGAILFLEDTGDHISRFDRMFIHLRNAGILKQISALILGEFNDLQDSTRPFGFTLEDILREHTEDLDVPVLVNAPFGHGSNLVTLPIGAETTLNTAQKSLQFL